MDNITAFYLPLSKIKINLKLAYAVYCALPSNIIKYMGCVNLFYITFTYNIYIRFLLLYYKMTKTGKKIHKNLTYFLFFFVLPNANMSHIYWINADNYRQKYLRRYFLLRSYP